MKEYQNPYNTGNRHYGGNISAMGWKAGQTQRAYDLSYDNLSRLTGAKYYETNANGRYSTQYTYDSMGNILTLKRNGLQDGGTYGLVDNLTYTYNGNQLIKISDSVEAPIYVGAFNFRDGADSSAEYTYDVVGNMTSDKNKGITSITYNDINQPQKISGILFTISHNDSNLFNHGEGSIPLYPSICFKVKGKTVYVISNLDYLLKEISQCQESPKQDIIMVWKHYYNDAVMYYIGTDGEIRLETTRPDTVLVKKQVRFEAPAIKK